MPESRPMPYLVRFPCPHHKAAAPDCAVYRVDERGRLWLRCPACGWDGPAAETRLILVEGRQPATGCRGAASPSSHP